MEEIKPSMINKKYFLELQKSWYNYNYNWLKLNNTFKDIPKDLKEVETDNKKYEELLEQKEELPKDKTTSLLVTGMAIEEKEIIEESGKFPEKVHELDSSIGELKVYGTIDNRYYTPTIDEFYIGFEYEEYEQCLMYLPDGKTPFWKQVIFGEVCEEELDYVYNCLDMNPPTVRVKYLDKEDIELLGWEYVDKPWETQIRRLKSEYVGKDLSNNLHGFYDSDYYYFMSYNHATHSLCIHNNEDYESSTVWFDGIIKNKSELKKLMKQLNIC